MNPELHREVLPRLVADFAFKDRGKEFLQQGKCPDCGHKELYVHAEHPWMVRCGRLNKCGVELHIKELYPELFSSWSDRYQPTPDNPNPNIAADAYLRDGRGFNIGQIQGCYSQGSYYCGKRDIGTATVRFTLPGGAYWERFIDNPQRFGKMKANFVGSYKGQWWQPPNLDTTAGEIWLTEGIFDAIALLQNGVQAVSLMSCNNYPELALAGLREQLGDLPRGKRPTLVFALDDGPAGEKYTKRHVKRACEEGWHATAAQPPQGRGKLDWNELHQRGRLEPKHLEEYRYLGRLLIARSPTEKALLMHNRTEQKEFPFGFDNRLFWFKLDFDRYMKALDHVYNTAAEGEELTEEEAKERALTESGSVVEIAACYPQALYYQANELTDESWYYFRVSFPHDGAPVKNTFTGGQLSSASEFKKRLMGMAPGAVWTGTSGQLDRLMKTQLYNIKRVQTCDFIGYSKEHGAYVFGDVAVKDGRLHRLNEEDFFDLGKLSIKSLNGSVNLHLNPDLKELERHWPRTLWNAFGAKGFVALAFWFGSFFAEQIRASQKSYPFLEIVGEPGTGKSTLIEFMWKLCGRRDYEGFDPSKSTLAARARNFAQVANMPVVLIEGDRGDGKDAKQRGFDWDELKTAYNGRSVRARGLRNSGNETYEPPFRGAIVIAQNAEVQASEAVLQRIIHLHTDRSGQNAGTKTAAEALERMPTEAVSGWLLKCAMAEREVLSLFAERCRQYERELETNPDLKNIRIIKNHSQLMALVDCLSLVAEVNEEQQAATRALLARMAVQRQQAVSADHPMVQEFWDAFDYLDGDDDFPVLNHSRDEQLLAVNLNHFAQVASERRQDVPPMTELKRLLKTSRARKFVEVRTVNSAINGRWNQRYPTDKRPSSIKCWVFEKER